MKLFLDDHFSQVIQERKAVFADNDFLGLIYHDEELLKEILTLLSGKRIYIYPFTEFEFLREVFDPKIRNLKEQFIDKSIFGHIKEEIHMRILPRIIKNAMLLSKIYAHQRRGGDKITSSFVDLFLAALLMFLSEKIVLITGNKKDFPSCVFDILSILNIEQEDGNMRAICVIKFNQEKFNSCNGQLMKLET